MATANPVSLPYDSNLAGFLKVANNAPVLSAEHEARLARKFRDNEDVNAAGELVVSQLRHVIHVAKGFTGYGLPVSDLIQEGNIGLMKAVKNFDPERGIRLVSYAVHWIKAEIYEYVLKNWKIVKVATTKAQRKLFFNLRSSKKSLGWLSPEEAQAIADDLGVDVKNVQEMEGRLSNYDLGFDAPTDADDEESYQSPVYYLEDKSQDPATLLEHDNTESTNNDLLVRGLELLDERSRDIVQRRWLAEDKATLHDLADEYGVSAERIRQVEAAAMKKIRKLIESEDPS